ncbi:MAG TPA: valine--tRNA ligase, partial [Methylomirabilota bacterium]|nr:valine--tRNA ligase [Methylomirabilota bacterium]
MSEIADRYDPTAVEPRWYAVWEERGYFHADPASPKKPYCIVIPPPNVTGSLHLGHALNNTLQDILIRYKRMDGYNALWMPGTDHAGIATQFVVERQLEKEGKTKEDLGREAFIARVWQWKEESGGTIIRQLKRLGASCDWARERFTMDPGLSAAVREVFVRLWEDGLIYQGDYIVNWCPRCQTVLSDLEVEREEQDAEFVYIKYGPLTLGTVRPETKLGDTAVAVHPRDKRYKRYVGKTLEVPSVEGNVTLRVVADAAVDPKFGTGVIKVTPGHDPTDFEIGRRHDLPIRSVIGLDGKMTALAGKYAGLDRFETRKRIVEDMHSLGLIDRVEPYRHSVGVCYRCKTVVEPLVSKQWYVRTKALAEPAIKAVRSGKIKIVPRAWTKTYFHWMENIRDWTISRQLWWGHRIPVWYCDNDGSMHVSRTDLTACPQCGGGLRQETDVLDTWFSSGLWPFSTLGWPEDTPELKVFYPTSVLSTGFDILFFWVARMAMLGIKFMGDVPFRHVYIHALIRDAEGQKMSKSKGNAVDPLSVMERYGTDAFRFTLAALAGLGRDIRVSEERIESYRNFANKLWNASRLVLSNLDGYDARAARTAEPALPDRWIRSRLAATIGAVRKHLKIYRFNDAAGGIYLFVWNELCDWYLEMAKLALYRPEAPARRLAAQHTL